MLALKSSERATKPYAVIDKPGNNIYLFFKFNGGALCMKKVDTTLFNVCDAYKGWLDPDEEDEDSEYSAYGIAQRTSPIAVISAPGIDKNFSYYRASSNTRMYLAAENRSSMFDFSDSSYAAYRDIHGVLRVWYTYGERIGIKSSYNDGGSWVDTAKKILFHNIPEDDADDSGFTVEDLQDEYMAKTYTECTVISEFKDSKFCERSFDPSENTYDINSGQPTPSESFDIVDYYSDERRDGEFGTSKTEECPGYLGEIQTIYDHYTDKVEIAFTFGNSIFVRQVDNSLLKFIEGLQPPQEEEDSSETSETEAERQLSKLGYIYYKILNLDEDSPNIPVIIDGPGESDVFYEEPAEYSNAPKDNIMNHAQPDGYYTRKGFLKLYYFVLTRNAADISITINGTNEYQPGETYTDVINYTVNENDLITLWMAALSRPEHAPI